MDIFSPQLNIPVKPSAKQYLLARGYASGMDIFEIRHQHLLALVTKLTVGGRKKKDVATDLDLGASHFSQLLGGKKMGEDVARKIEKAQGLPAGWMDHADPILRSNRVAQDRAEYNVTPLHRIDSETIATALKLARLSFQNLKLDLNLEADGKPLVYAYEFLQKRRDKSVSAENLIEFSDWLRKEIAGNPSN